MLSVPFVPLICRKTLHVTEFITLSRYNRRHLLQPYRIFLFGAPLRSHLPPALTHPSQPCPATSINLLIYLLQFMGFLCNAAANVLFSSLRFSNFKANTRQHFCQGTPFLNFTLLFIFSREKVPAALLLRQQIYNEHDYAKYEQYSACNTV